MLIELSWYETFKFYVKLRVRLGKVNCLTNYKFNKLIKINKKNLNSIENNSLFINFISIKINAVKSLENLN